MIANRYEVMKHIGQGGMADVFLAVDTILNRHVAVKILRADLSSDEVSILRFEREAQAVTALVHPNIVEVYDVGDYKGHHYIVMEYVEGKTLKQLIKDRGPLLIDEAVDIMKQLSSAIAEAHSRGIIHRDIKPQNIIVKSDGTIKILDFGIATAQGSMQLTQANNVMGSVHYLAPELAKGNSATRQSDIYALGIVLFEMLAGDVPFKADQAVQIAMLHIKEPFPRVRAINPTVPQSVENIILKATMKNPEYRYHTADEMLKDLSTCLMAERADEKPLGMADDSQSRQPISFSQGYVEEEDEEEDTEERKYRRKQERAKRAPRKKRKMGNITKLLIAGVLLLVLLVGFFLYRSLQNRVINVPDLTNLTVAEATEVCSENHLLLDTVNVTYELTRSTEKGYIISSSPAAQEEVENGSSIKIVVSSGIGVEMPDFVGKNIQDVEEELTRYPYLTVETMEEADSGYDSGTVLAQNGVTARQLFDPNTPATITLSYAAYETIVIPESILGMNYNDASNVLTSMGVRAYASLIDPSTLSTEELVRIKEENLVGTVKYTDPYVGNYYTQKEDNYIVLYYYSYADITPHEEPEVENNES